MVWFNMIVQLLLAGVILRLIYGLHIWRRAIKGLHEAMQANQDHLHIAIDQLNGMERRLRIVERNSGESRNSRGRPV